MGVPGTRRVVRAWIWNRNKERVSHLQRESRSTLLPAGAAKFYQYTTNPDVSSGDGIAMAWRARDVRVADLEFNQFHPTALYITPRRVISCLLKRCAAKAPTINARMAPALCPDFDERGELALRDIVARAIDHEMKRLGVD
ncbi:FAD-binding protein [Klebsiella pneumoniae]|nr:FAD-binding protein [Klebsiella pneumoniae]